MAFKKRTWTNRVTEYPTRRTLVKADGSSEIVTVERNEGTVSSEGDAFDADNMNYLESRIEAGFKDLGGLTFVYMPYEEYMALEEKAENTVYITF